MNPIDHQLNRLFRAARRAPDDFISAAPFGLETRILAAWRGNRPTAFWDTALLVRGLILAGIVMLLSFWPVISQTSNPVSESLQLADSDLSSQMDFTP